MAINQYKFFDSLHGHLLSSTANILTCQAVSDPHLRLRSMLTPNGGSRFCNKGQLHLTLRFDYIVTLRNCKLLNVFFTRFSLGNDVRVY